MRKLLFATLTICFLLGLIVLVSALQTSKDIVGYGAIEGNYVEANFKFMKGWNLVQGLPNPEWLSGGDIESSNIKAIYGFNPVTQEYIRFYPQPEKSKLNSQNTRVDSMISATSFWVYIDSPQKEYGQINYLTLEPNTELSKQLLTGWNFASIMPNFINKSFNDLKGNCNIEKMYWWQSRDQQWMNILSDKDRMEVLRYSENIGSGLLIKVSESCTLLTGIVDNPSDIPGAPAIPNIKECTDSDGGSVIDVQGTATNSEESKQDICSTSNNKLLIEYDCDSSTGNVKSNEFDCSERGFATCNSGKCIN
ncbi:MAG: hypothetical protein Q7S74_03000 [Nanoarchaeota archaeon]|nr:hypothetical protein [Nanoarchaeota archaeon]